MANNEVRVVHLHSMRRLLPVILLLLPALCLAQESLTFEGLRERLLRRFDPSVIESLRRQFPDEAKFAAWGYDIGDFSADGLPDLALAVRLPDAPPRTEKIFMFVSETQFDPGDVFFAHPKERLRLVHSFDVEYYQSPIEVGVLIRENICSVITKKADGDWAVSGYTFETGDVILVNEFETVEEKSGEGGTVGTERDKNYRSLVEQRSFFTVGGAGDIAKRVWMVLPSYKRGRDVYKGYVGGISDSVQSFVTSGIADWQGPQDLSFRIRSSYDDEFLYLSLSVRDDEVIRNEVEPSHNDYVELWFDKAQGERHLRHAHEVPPVFRDSADADVMMFRIALSSRAEPHPKLQFIPHSGTSDSVTNELVKKVRVLDSILIGKGYTVRIRLPLQLVGLDGSADSSAAKHGRFSETEVGFTALVHDVDNEFRPEYSTTMATSQFTPWNPSTFGTLAVIPDEGFFGWAMNVYTDRILNRLRDVGF